MSQTEQERAHVTKHAKKRYLRRMMSINPVYAREEDFEKAENEILSVVEDPDIIYKDADHERYDAPIYIKEDVAAPLNKDGSIPTVLPAGPFKKKIYG